MMLIEPASKVSVPLTVVMRTLSSVPESVLFPADTIAQVLAGAANTPFDTHIFEPTKFNTIEPRKALAELLACDVMNPVVAVPVAIVETANKVADAEYPVVLTLPSPI